MAYNAAVHKQDNEVQGGNGALAAAEAQRENNEAEAEDLNTKMLAVQANITQEDSVVHRAEAGVEGSEARLDTQQEVVQQSIHTSTLTHLVQKVIRLKKSMIDIQQNLTQGKPVAKGTGV